MKAITVFTLAALCLVLNNSRAWAADKPDEKPGQTATTKATPKSDLQALVSKVQSKLRGGTVTEKDLEDEFKEFDVLLAKYKDEKTDDVARILVMKAMLYGHLEITEKATALMRKVKTDFPDTEQAKNADKAIEQLENHAKAKQIQKDLVVGKKFPDFEEKDLDGKPLSVAKYKGKVVLVDFWATWCGPCVRELPSVMKAYEKHHDKGFEIIGISLDQDKSKLTTFIGDKGMKWPQYFDGKGWGSKLAGKYGINSIPATFLLDGEGKIIGKNLRGDELEQAVAKSLSK